MKIEEKTNKTLYLDAYKDYEVGVVQTDYGALIAWWGYTYPHSGIRNCRTWWGGFKDLNNAKITLWKSIDEDIVFEEKRQRAQKAYNLVMAGQ